MSPAVIRIGPLPTRTLQAAFPTPGGHPDAAARVRRDQLFLRVALRTQRMSVEPRERAAFDRRADAILDQLDPPTTAAIAPHRLEELRAA